MTMQVRVRQRDVGHGHDKTVTGLNSLFFWIRSARQGRRTRARLLTTPFGASGQQDHASSCYIRGYIWGTRTCR